MFDARARRVIKAREDLELAEADAVALGLDLSGDLNKLAGRLRSEIFSLFLLIS